MKIEFLRPLYLFLIPLLIFIYLFILKVNKRKIREYIVPITIRVISTILIILSLTGVLFKWEIKDTTTLFVMDLSDSMEKKFGVGEEFIKESLKSKPDSDLAGVITFGRDAKIENTPSKDTAFTGFGAKVIGSYTDIERALSLSLSLIPDYTKGRLVLISDGEENSGSITKLIPSIKERNFDVKVLKIDREVSDEVAIDKIKLPKSARVGEEVGITVEVLSNVSTLGNLYIYSGSNLLLSKEITIEKGVNRFVYNDKVTGGGFKGYRAVIEPSKDTISENNEAAALINILDRPRILVLEDKAGEAVEIEKMLKSLGLDYELRNSKRAPILLSEMAGFKSIILCNVSAENLKQEFLDNLPNYVKELGGGLIAAGGEDSFALGGYFKTSLEKVLPVNMELKGKKEIPEMAMLLVIDKSGSMSETKGVITKLDIAKEAAVRVLDSLREKDEIGVLAFDSGIYNVVKLKKADKVDEIKDDIGTLRPGGGTSILPALDEAYNTIVKSSAKIKHIILLTDGQAEKTGYEELLKKFNKDNITVSTVAVGEGADAGLLEGIAKTAKGRFYKTNDYENIPRIFAKETFMAARNYLNNRKFAPEIVNYHPVLSGVFNDGMPYLYGYIASSPKDTATVLLNSDEEDPILTVWQYGLGKTAAWNSDIKGIWSRDFISFEKNIKLWQNIINYTVGNVNLDNLILEAEEKGSKVTVTLTDKNFTKEYETKASIIFPNGDVSEINLYPTGAGKYSGEFEITGKGNYMINGRQLDNGEIKKSVNTGISIYYSPEYRLNLKEDLRNLEKLVDETKGKFIKSPSEVFQKNDLKLQGIRDLTDILLILGLILFFLDVFVRRFYNILLSYLYKIKGISQIGLYRIKNIIIKGKGTKGSSFLDGIKLLKNKALKHRIKKNPLEDRDLNSKDQTKSSGDREFNSKDQTKSSENRVSKSVDQVKSSESIESQHVDYKAVDKGTKSVEVKANVNDGTSKLEDKKKYPDSRNFKPTNDGPSEIGDLKQRTDKNDKDKDEKRQSIDTSKLLKGLNRNKDR